MDEPGSGHRLDADHLAMIDFRRDPEWVQWWRDNLPHGLLANYIYVEDRDDAEMRLTPRRKAGGYTLSYHVPAKRFYMGQPARDVWRELRRDLFVYAAEKLGWPEPPALPPYAQID
jgi:hypothetical protein